MLESVAISASAGKGGKNGVKDVLIIQDLLNEWRRRNGRQPIREDGLVGQETIGAITDFQRANGLATDGRVDPAGPTLQGLKLHAEQLAAEAAILLTVAFVLGTEFHANGLAMVTANGVAGVVQKMRA